MKSKKKAIVRIDNVTWKVANNPNSSRYTASEGIKKATIVDTKMMIKSA
jgi:ribosomal protein S8E